MGERFGPDAGIAGMAPFEFEASREYEFMLGASGEHIFECGFEILPPVQRADGPIPLQSVVQMGERTAD
jgi:hypothetical protein